MKPRLQSHNIFSVGKTGKRPSDDVRANVTISDSVTLFSISKPVLDTASTTIKAIDAAPAGDAV